MFQNHKKTHWEEMISAIESARKLAMHHSDVIGGRGGEMTSLVIKQCQNGRSRVARSALEAVRDLFRFLRKSLLGQLDAAVKVLLGSFLYRINYTTQDFKKFQNIQKLKLNLNFQIRAI